MTTADAHRVFSGICVASGIGIGRAFVYRKGAPVITRRRVAHNQVDGEVERFLNTLHQAGEEIRRIRRLVASEQGEELAQIFDAQLAMLEDPGVKEQTEALVRGKHYSAEKAYSEVLGQTSQRCVKVKQTQGEYGIINTNDRYNATGCYCQKSKGEIGW